MYSQQSQSGQILLITLLVLTIATTVVLSVIGRSSSDVSLSNQVSESATALSAAEAGIEESLKSGTGTVGAQTLTTGVTYNVTRTDTGAGASYYQFPKKTSVDSVETLWLVPHNGSIMDDSDQYYEANTIDVCWSDGTPKPALLVSIWYKRGGAIRIARGAYDPDPSSRSTTNNFSDDDATSGCSGSGLAYKKTITFTDFDSPAINPTSDILLFLRLQPIYNDATIAVAPSTDGLLPAQGSKLDSVGSVASGVTRKVVVYQQYKTPESIFDNVVYSQNTFNQ